MAKATTIRLNGDDTRLLEELSAEFGSPSDAVREGLRMLAAQSKRRRALREFQDEWVAEIGPPDPAEVAELGRRLFDE
ncbi:MAG: hypothetical protein F4078_00440 [Acidimicrobiia bacterium]|nr:hypothetical protein [Acidimicrobiia bacterium]